MEEHYVIRRLTAEDIPAAHDLEVLSYPEVRWMDGLDKLPPPTSIFPLTPPPPPPLDWTSSPHPPASSH